MRLNHLAQKKARIEMLPLVDIIFLVLVVFIYAMLSMAIHRGLPVYLPQATTTTIETAASLTINIQADGSIFVNRQPAPLGHLSERLASLAAGEHESKVLLLAHRDLSYQQILVVLDQIRRAGLTRVSLQAEPTLRP